MRKGLKSRAEFYFLDAPYTVENASEASAIESAGIVEGGRSWWLWEDIAVDSRPSKAAKYSGWEASYNAIDEAVSQNKADVLLGFSQGATAAALYLADASKRKPAPLLLSKGVFIGGFLPRDEEYAGIIEAAAPIDVDSLHVSGQKDELIPPDRSELLWRCFEERNRQTWMHEGKHMVPTCSGEFKKAMLGFVSAI